MRNGVGTVFALLLVASRVSAQSMPLLAAPSEQGVVLRWVWGEGARPAGYFVERRSAGGAAWTRLTTQPLTRVRDRAAARSRLGDRFDRYAGLLFPEDPRAERADPETFRGILLLAADIEPGVAHVLGLRYDDVSATTGMAYEYRLLALTESGERVAATSGAVVAGGYRQPAGPESPVAVNGSRGAALRWVQAPRFSAYHVYRGARRDGSDARRLNAAPVIVFTRDDGSVEASATFFTDTAPPVRDSAYYRVEGIDAFGRPSLRSAAAAFAWRSVAALGAPVLVQTRVQGDTVVVAWQEPPDTGVTAYQVWRSESDTGPFAKLGSLVRAPEREQRDPGRSERRLNWYRVTAIDRAGRESDPSTVALAEIPDLTPPPPPESVTGTADTGRLSLRWRPVAASDLRGYRVYRATAPDGTYGLLSPTPRLTPAFTDTIPVRADHPFYYRVTAVDSAFNESAPSGVLALRPPDITPPSAPRIGQVRPQDGALVITWLANPEPDIASYRVRFRVKGETAWRDGSVSPATRLSDTIPGLAPGRAHEVTLIAIDDAGNESAQAPVMAGTPVRRTPPARPDLRRVVFEPRERGVVVSWSAPTDGVVELLVLRREEGQGLRPVGALRAGATRFVDRTVRVGRRYEYIVEARDAFGNRAESRSLPVESPKSGS